MKILVVAPYTFSPPRSGGQKFISQFLDALGQQATVTVVSTGQGEGYSPSPHYRLLPALAYSFFRYTDITLKATLIDLIQRNRYDWIIWEHPYYGWLAKTIKSKTGIKTLIHTHNIEHQRFRSLKKIWWPLMERYEKAAFQLADKIGFITKNDKDFATEKWNIDPRLCLDIPYGITIDAFPTDRSDCREVILKKHGLNPGDTFLLFNGALDYAPNYHALTGILKELLPRLQAKSSQDFTLLVCGKGLPKRDKQLKAYENLKVHYAGFVEDVDCYFKGSDIFLNPVTKGGGVKTKMIESIALGTPVIAMKTGATGVSPSLCSPMLKITEDQDWEQFTDEVIRMRHRLGSETLTTPAEFYTYYHWKAITERLLSALTD